MHYNDNPKGDYGKGIREVDSRYLGNFINIFTQYHLKRRPPHRDRVILNSRTNTQQTLQYIESLTNNTVYSELNTTQFDLEIPETKLKINANFHHLILSL
ncbi:hypothetical protein DMUE_0285 [Dictyocoela muelleri]|nr:hypothetical protein DMUE_0285 [Dictyocoela muelleri]